MGCKASMCRLSQRRKWNNHELTSNESTTHENISITQSSKVLCRVFERNVDDTKNMFWVVIIYAGRSVPMCFRHTVVRKAPME